MSDQVPIEQTRGRGPGWGVVTGVIALAFLAGLALMGYAMKRFGWLGAAPATTTAPRVARPNGVGFTPSQPIGPGDSQPVAPELDPTMLATREATLAGQLSALETRIAAIGSDATAAGGQATRAEGLLIAFAARRAIDRGIGLGYIEEQLRSRFGQTQPRAVTIVLQAARSPVTLEDLRQGLEAIAPEIATGGTDESWFGGIEREFGNLVVLRKAGTPSPLPADRLARARRLLEGGQVEAARAEVARLPGASDAGNWLNAARRYAVARQALDMIENAAILGQGGPAQPLPVAQPITTTTAPAP